jgi:hypothetical protein
MNTDGLAYHTPSWYVRGIFPRDVELRFCLDAVQLIKVYVPESDVLCFEDALELALRRDEQRAYELAATEMENENEGEKRT